MIRLVYLLALLSISCSQKDSKILDFGKFTIEVPNRWQKIRLNGIDSYVGRIKIDNRDSVEFDLGPYSSNLNSEGQTYEYLTIDEKKAKIVRPVVPEKGTTGLYIDSIGDSDVGRIRFQINGQNLSVLNQELLIKAFKTIKFDKSPTLYFHLH